MKRRKVGNLLGLAVLSVVLERPMHPYEMAAVLKERGKDADLPIKWGSLYTVVANLEKHGFLAAVESVKDGGRPERTVYRITPAGRDSSRTGCASSSARSTRNRRGSGPGCR